jgi:thymidylate synthase
MEEVFFGRNPTVFGHSYAGLMRGPGGRNDLLDIIDLLKKEPWSKRATLTLCGEANSKVPCINVVQFLVRENAVQAFYFARGQDIFRKFYADGHCIGCLAQKVAQGLGIKAGLVTGFIGSSHIYHSDMTAIRRVLEDGAEYLQRDEESDPIESGLVAKEASR